MVGDEHYDPKERTFVDVKTSASHRKVPIAAALRDYLIAHKLGSGRGDRDLVFGRTPDLPFIARTSIAAPAPPGSA